MKRNAVLVTLCLLLGVAVGACDNATPTPTVGPTTVGQVVATVTLAIPQRAPTVTPLPTSTIDTTPKPPTRTPVPTWTPAPTNTPDVSVSDNQDSLVIQTLLVQINAAQWIQDSFRTSNDKKRIGYISAMGGNYVVYMDGKQGKEYSGVLEGTITFSPDNKKYAYAAVNKDAKAVIVVDGEEGKPYRTLEAGLLFSPDSLHIAHGAGELLAPTAGATPALRQFVVLDGKEGKQYDTLIKASLQFSLNGKKLGYVASSGGKQFVVMQDTDGQEPAQESKPYESVFSLALSPDGARYGFGVTAGAKRLVVIDGQEGKGYYGIGNGSPIFSPDGAHTAYLAQTDDAHALIVFDGQEGKTYEAINGSPAFSPDGKHLAYVAKQNGKLMLVIHDLGNPSFAASGQEGKQYEVVGSTLVFSADGTRVAYVAGAASKQFVILKDIATQGPEQEGKTYDGIGRGTLVFSPDGKRLAYVAGQSSKQIVVVDGQESRPYAGVERGSVTFSPDSKHLVYSATEAEKQFAVLDGVESQKYDSAGKGGIIFNSPNSFYYLGVLNNIEIRLGNVYQVEHKIKQ